MTTPSSPPRKERLAVESDLQQASTDKAGLIAVATQQQVTAGASDSLAVTPKTLDVALAPIEEAIAGKASTAAVEEAAAAAQAALAASGKLTPTRPMTASGPVVPADSAQLVLADFAVAGTVTLPLSTPGSAAGTWPTTGASLIEVDRFGSDVEVVPYLPASPFQRVIAPRGRKIAVVGGAAHLTKLPPGPELPLPGPFWAVLDFDQFSAQPHGTPVVNVVPHAASTVTLPPIVPGAGTRPTVHRNALNGHTGLAFNGAGQCLPLTGAWLSLLSDRPNAAIYVTYLVTAPGLSGDRTLISFSRVFIKQRDNGSGLIVVGGRRLGTETAGVFANAGPSNPPDAAVAGARFVFSSSDLYALKNGAVVNSTTAFQTDGNSGPDPVPAACIGASATGVDQFYWGTMLHIAIGPDTAALASQYQAWSLARYRETWVVGGDVTE